MVPVKNSRAKSIFLLFHLKLKTARGEAFLGFPMVLEMTSVRTPDYLFITVVNEIYMKMNKAEKIIFHEFTFLSRKRRNSKGIKVNQRKERFGN